MNLKDKTIGILDYGNYVAFGQALSPFFKKVYYATVWQTAFPRWSQYCIGMGVYEIERVDTLWEVWDELDMICLPDLFQGPFADWIVQYGGKPVFGARMGENMEIYRDEFKEILEDLNLPVNKYQRIEGISALKSFLKNKSNKFIKVNLLRGNMETFHYIDERLSHTRMVDLERELGAYAEHAVFIVDDPIEDAIEIGADLYCINGEFPENALMGVEVKDAGYAGMWMPYSQLPQILKDINKKFKGLFAGTGYKCNFSNEVRWTGKKGYFLDFTARLPQPPSDLMAGMIINFGEVIWNIAHGVVPEIKIKAKFGAQCIIKSDWAEDNPQPIWFPEKYRNNVRIKNLMVTDGTYHYIPTTSMQEIGSVVGWGNTMKEAIEMVKTISKTVEGDSVTINCDKMDEAASEIKKLKDYGINLL